MLLRKALGARRVQVLAMMMREVLGMLLAGLAAGILAAHPLTSMLYQLSPFSLVSFALAMAAVIVVAEGAAWLRAP